MKELKAGNTNMPATTHFKKADIINLIVEMSEIEDWIIETCNKKINKNKIREIKITLSDTKIAVFKKTNENDYIYTHTETIPETYKP